MQVVVEHRGPPAAGAVGNSGLVSEPPSPCPEGGARPAPVAVLPNTLTLTPRTRQDAHNTKPEGISEKQYTAIKTPKSQSQHQGLLVPHPARPARLIVVTAPVPPPRARPFPFGSQF